jgi:hypothetical protein
MKNGVQSLFMTLAYVEQCFVDSKIDLNSSIAKEVSGSRPYISLFASTSLSICWHIRSNNSRLSCCILPFKYSALIVFPARRRNSRVISENLATSPASLARITSENKFAIALRASSPAFLQNSLLPDRDWMTTFK